MRLTAAILGSLGLMVLVAARCNPAVAADATDSKAAADAKAAVAASDQVIDGFVKSIQDRKDLDDAKRQALLSAIETQRRDEDLRAATITDALFSLHPEFRDATQALAEENTDKAIPLLEKLAASDDPYLAAEAAYFLSTGLMMSERFESALPVLETLRDKLHDKTLHGGESLFLLGSAQARLLLRKEAIKSLEQYITKYEATAPERLYVGAFRQIAELQGLEDGSLVDVQDRMDFSRRRLALQRTADRTRTEQDNIIAMLDKLIEEAEKKEGSCCGGGSGSGSGQGPQGGINPGGGATRSTPPGGAASQGPLAKVNRGTIKWGEHRDKDREKVMSALKEKFPDRYRELVEKYYESLQKSGR